MGENVNKKEETKKKLIQKLFHVYHKMAEYLASIFGTEKDKVNCSFYFKIGACRHGDRCSRIHNKPTFCQTIVLNNLYINPQNSAKSADGSHLTNVSDEEMQEHCDNLGDHLVGNVYIKFRREEDAARAVAELNNRWFGGRPIYAELSPVTDFREACCRQYEMGECVRSGFCNFMHLKPISRDLRRELYGRRGAQSGLGNHGRKAGGREPRNERREERSRSRERKRSRSRERRRSRSRDRAGRSGRY